MFSGLGPGAGTFTGGGGSSRAAWNSASGLPTSAMQTAVRWNPRWTLPCPVRRKRDGNASMPIPRMPLCAAAGSGGLGGPVGILSGLDRRSALCIHPQGARGCLLDTGPFTLGSRLLRLRRGGGRFGVVGKPCLSEGRRAEKPHSPVPGGSAGRSSDRPFRPADCSRTAARKEAGKIRMPRALRRPASRRPPSRTASGTGPTLPCGAFLVSITQTITQAISGGTGYDPPASGLEARSLRVPFGIYGVAQALSMSRHAKPTLVHLKRAGRKRPQEAPDPAKSVAQSSAVRGRNPGPDGGQIFTCHLKHRARCGGSSRFPAPSRDSSPFGAFCQRHPAMVSRQKPFKSVSELPILAIETECRGKGCAAHGGCSPALSLATKTPAGCRDLPVPHKKDCQSRVVDEL